MCLTNSALVGERILTLLKNARYNNKNYLPLLHTTSFLRILATDSQSIDCSAVVRIRKKNLVSVIGVDFEVKYEIP
jgi:hypothetical protein